MSAVRDLTGVPIDHFAEINLAGFYDLTDALGGVEVCLNQPVSDDYSGADFPRRDVRRSTMPGAGCAPQEAANEVSAGSASRSEPTTLRRPAERPGGRPHRADRRGSNDRHSRSRKTPSGQRDTVR